MSENSDKQTGSFEDTVAINRARPAGLAAVVACISAADRTGPGIVTLVPTPAQAR